MPTPCFSIFSDSSIILFSVCSDCFFFGAKSRAGLALITKCHELVVRLGRVEVGLGIERERIRGRAAERISG
jgi:hypothetical protein